VLLEEPLVLAGETTDGIVVCARAESAGRLELKIPLEQGRVLESVRWPEYPELKVWRFLNGNAVRWWFPRIPGDGNGDGLVNGMDLMPLAVYFGERKEFHTENEYADYNEDGWINGQDLFVLAENYNTGYDGVNLEIYEGEWDAKPAQVKSFGFQGFEEYGYLDGSIRGGRYELHWYAGEEVESNGCDMTLQPVPDFDELADYLEISAVGEEGNNRVTLTYSFLMNGDLNRDGEVTSLDTFSISGTYGQSSGYNGTTRTSESAQKCDTDYDGKVGMSDIYVLSMLIFDRPAYEPRIYRYSPVGGELIWEDFFDTPQWSETTEENGLVRATCTQVIYYWWRDETRYLTYSFFPAATREVGDRRVLEVGLKEIVVEEQGSGL
jgi:hypothetical protein